MPHHHRRSTSWSVLPVGRLRSVLVVVLALLASGAMFALGPSGASTEDGPTAALADGAQSTRVAGILEQLPTGGAAPVVIVVDWPDGGVLSEADLAAVRGSAERFAAYAVGGRPGEVEVSEDGRVATRTVLLPDAPDEETYATVGEVRSVAAEGLPDGLRAQVTGGPAFATDLSEVFDGADTRLLIATAAVVAVLLLITYRSPILWLVPLVVVAVADRLATVVVGAVAPGLGVVVDGAAAGILSVLVFGSGTDYALLLVSRYRDQLTVDEDRVTAMRKALRATVPAVLASGGTVVLSLLTLLLADLGSNRGLGVACAIGIVIAMVFGLVVLPAALVLPGRWLFWPLVPRVGHPVDHQAGVWGRIGRRVAGRPALVAIAAVVLLGALASGSTQARVGLAATEQFRVEPEAVTAQQVLAEAFPAGSTQPLTVLARPSSAEQVVEVARASEGVAGAQATTTEGEWAVLSVVLSAAPGTDESDESIRALRESLAEVAGAEALVGGTTAEALDTADAVARDTRVVVPLVLILVLLVLAALLRSVLGPVLLVLTVVASYFASLGASWVIFRTVYDFPALDTLLPLLSFLFLVALGVDYNIFLIARTREEVLGGLATRPAVLDALASTGGVITSAGILLAAVFAVLGVLPLITLTQIGVIVGIGVLLDTLLVRTLVVPALVLLLGRRFWWPGRPEQVGDGQSQEHGVRTPALAGE